MVKVDLTTSFEFNQAEFFPTSFKFSHEKDVDENFQLVKLGSCVYNSSCHRSKSFSPMANSLRG